MDKKWLFNTLNGTARVEAFFKLCEYEVATQATMLKDFKRDSNTLSDSTMVHALEHLVKCGLVSKTKIQKETPGARRRRSHVKKKFYINQWALTEKGKLYKGWLYE